MIEISLLYEKGEDMGTECKKRLFMGTSIVILLLVIDQYTKFLAVTYLQNTSGVDIVKGIFRLQYLENTGAAFGMLAGHLGFFYVITIIIVAVISLVLTRLPNKKRYTPMWICGITLIAGALGNLIDRLRLEYVVDFLYFELIDFPIFNIADIYVCVAAAMFVILMVTYYKDEDLDQIDLGLSFLNKKN